jgi:ribonuclease P protein component
VFPVKLFYTIADDDQTIKAGVGVSARNFKKAVDRNRIKRLLRECYRLNKLSLHTTVAAKQKGVSVFFSMLEKNYRTMQC